MLAPIRPALSVNRSLYYASKLTAQTAQNLMLATLFVVAGTSSGAAIGLSSIFVAVLVPAVLVGPVGGALVDRTGPARGLVIGAVLRFLPIAAAVFFLDGPAWAWAVAFAYSTASQVFTPAEMALVRTLQRDNPGRAHSWLVALQYAGQGIGMLVLAPVLYVLGGPTAMLAGSAAGLVVVTTLATVLAVRLRGTPAVQVQSTREAFSLNSTVRFFARDGVAGYAVVVLAFKTIVSRTVMVALPFYLARDIGMGEGMLVFLVAPGIAGVAAALLWSGRFLQPSAARGVMRASLFGMMLAVFALAALDYAVTAAAHYSQVPPVAHLEASMNTTFVVAIPVAFLLGIVLTTSLVAARAALTESAPLGQQARVFAIQETVSEALVVTPLLLAGVGTQFAGARPTLALVGVLAAVALVGLELLTSKVRVPATATPVLETVPVRRES